VPFSNLGPWIAVVAGLRLIFIDGNHFYNGVLEDYTALERQGDIFVIDDIASDQFKDHTLRFFNELAANPKLLCRQFVDKYPTIRVLFGIGVCVRRAFVVDSGRVVPVETGVWAFPPPPLLLCALCALCCPRRCFSSSGLNIPSS
jgi:hypothetical protein